MKKVYYTISELVGMGLSRHELTCATRIRGQQFAFRAGPRGRWRFNLEEYMKFVQSRMAEENLCNYIE